MRRVAAFACFCALAFGFTGMGNVVHAAPKKTKPKNARPVPRATKGKQPTTPRKTTPPSDVRHKVPAKRKPLTRAEKIVEAMLQAKGGRAALQAVKKVYAKGDGTIHTAMGARNYKLTYYYLKPHYQRLEQKIGKMKVIVVVYPKGGYMNQNGVQTALPKAMLRMQQDELARRDLELRYLTEPIKLTLKGKKSIAGQNYWHIQFTDAQQRKTHYLIHQKTHLLRQIIYKTRHPLTQAKVEIKTTVSEYRYFPLGKKTKQQVLFATKSTQYLNGHRVGSSRYRQVELNTRRVRKYKFRRYNPAE